MAHFAQLDENNVVLRVIVVHNNELVETKQTTIEESGNVSVSVVESEAKGIAFCQSLFGADTKWVQTSYNNNFRGKYAGIGDTYENGIFVAPVVETPVVEAPVVEVQATEPQPVLTSTDIPALTTSDISSLG